MAYRLKQDQGVSRGLKHLARKELRSAIDCLQGTRTKKRGRSEAVHEARKSIKKTRAIVELVREGLGKDYRRRKRDLRRAARPLSAERDADVLLATFDALRRQHRKQLPRQAWTAWRRALESSAARAKRRASGPTGTRRVLKALKHVRGTARSWSIDRGFEALKPGLERSFKRAQRALDRARSRRDAESLHRWRKRVKMHWYHVRLLEGVRPSRLKPYATKLRHIETWLGEHHNFTVLATRLRRAQVPLAHRAALARLRQLIQVAQRQLERKALAEARGVYAGNRKAAIRGIELLWHKWRAAR